MWKKIISMVLVICMLTSVVPQMALAEETSPEVSTPENTETINEENSLITSDEKWEYELYGEGVVLTKYLGTDADVYVPGTIDTVEGETYNVLKIGDSIFENNDGLNSATLGAGILEIGNRAFYDADSMVCVLISEQLTTIGDEAFYSCDNFNSIIIFDSVISIGENAFNECPKLVIWCNENSTGYAYAIQKSISYKIYKTDTTSSIETVEGVTYHIQNGEAYAISCDNTLKEVNILPTINGYPVVELRETFKNNDTLIKVTLPISLKVISNSAFYNCTSLVSVVIPDSVTTIGKNAFYNCSRLKDIVLSNSLLEIKQYTFYSCTQLTDINIPDGVIIIEASAFEQCDNLLNTKLSRNLERIGERAFYNCKKISSIIIPENVTFLGNSAFADCDSLVDIEIKGIPSIGSFAFSECVNLTQVNLGNTVSIGQKAFIRCTSLKEITITSSVKAIDTFAFDNCINLSEVNIMEGVENISNQAFVSCANIKKVVLPRSLTYMDYNVFHEDTLLVVEESSYAHSVAQQYNLHHMVCKNINQITFHYYNGVYYYILNDEAVAYDCIQNITEAIVLDKIENVSVTKLQETFMNCTSLEKVVLPDTLKEIGLNSFYNCTSLKNIELPEGLTTIESYAFYNCSSLVNISIPDNVSYLGEHVFYGCTQIIRVDLPSELTTIMAYMFYNCSALEEIIIPETVHTIGNYAFEGCTNLTSINLPNELSMISKGVFRSCTNLNNIKLHDGIVKIDEYAFSMCESLTEISLPDTITSFSEGIFKGCRNLISFTIPNNITEIPSRMFSDCESLTTVVFHDEITSISLNAFQNCVNLRSLTLPDKITIIQNYAFDGCTGLQEIILPSSLRGIGNYAFRECTGLTTITIPTGTRGIGSYAFYNCSNLCSVNMPTTVTQIEQQAFLGCQIKSITLSKSVKTIGKNAIADTVIMFVQEGSYAHEYAVNNNRSFVLWDGISEPQTIVQDGITYNICNNQGYAIGCETTLTNVTLPTTINGYDVTTLFGTFYNCDNLVNVTLPEGIKTIGRNTFYSCDNLTHITIPNSVDTIGYNAFTMSGLISIVLPEGITEIPQAFYSCKSLISVSLPESLTKIGEKAFCFCTKLQNINFPKNLNSIGIQAFNSCFGLLNVELNQGLVEIGQSAFTNCVNINEVYIPSSIKQFGDRPFSGCKNLTKLELEDGLTVIGYAAFEQCQGLQEISIPSSITTFGNYAFQECTSLSKVTLEEGIQSLGNYTFYKCKSLMKITIPGSIKQIGKYAFQMCSALYKVDIKNGVTDIGEGAFYNSSVSELILPKTVTSIGMHAFAECKYLKKIIIPSSITSWGNAAFRECSNLVEVIFESGLNCLGDYAFAECTSLKFVKIPKSITNPGTYTFKSCTSLKEVIIEDGVALIGNYMFYECTLLQTVSLLGGNTTIGREAFYNCYNLQKVNALNDSISIGSYAFYGCRSLKEFRLKGYISNIGGSAFANCNNMNEIRFKEGLLSIESNVFYNCISSSVTVFIPESVESMKINSFASNKVLLVYADSYGHNFAKENDLLYFVIRKTENPEIAYGKEITGTVKYTNGTVASDVNIDILYSDGTVKETTTTDASGLYSFTYAEVGRYIIRATDASGHIATQTVSVKRMNVFDVFVSGDTNLVLKNGWEIGGTVSENNANITLTDSEGNVLGSITTVDGSFIFENVPNGNYIIKAETEIGSVSKEITVFDGSISDIILAIPIETATVWGYVDVEDRAGKHHRRNWVQVSIYNEDGNIVAQKRSDIDGKYEFTKLPLGEYTIVAETTELRPDKKLGYDRNHTLTGYAYVNAEEISTYQVDTIILYEENDSITTVSGKVTANGETQDCEVTIRNVFHYEVAKQTTGKNGKYAFKNIRDGLYFITAITKSDGMGFAVIVVRNGRIYGETSIKVLKGSKVKALEAAFYKDVPECDSREEVLEYRERIAHEKRNYDALSKKEKKQLSQEYIVRLNQYCEWLANCEHTASEGVSIEGAGLVVSGGELENEDTVVFNLSVTEKEEHVLNGEGINSEEDYIQHSMEDAAQKQHEYGILKYYEISMTKQVGDGEAQTITSVYKNTEATGKFRITIEIPEEYRGYKHYSFIHVHNGEVVTLVDLDDNPNTVTFEVDAFSTFALLGTDEDQIGQFVVGDLDNDSDFTNLDIAIMRTYLTKKIKSFDFATSDVNSDNEVDIRDVIALKRGIVEGTLKNGEEGSEGGEVDSPEEEW